MLEFECETVNRRWQLAQEAADKANVDLQRVRRLQETTQEFLSDEQGARAAAERALSRQRALTLRYKK